MEGWDVVVRFIGIGIKDCPGSRCLISIWPTMEKVHPCLLQVQKKGQGPETPCHQFTPCQSLVQFNLCPHHTSSVSVPGWNQPMLWCHIGYLDLCLKPAWSPCTARPTLGDHVAAGPTWLLHINLWEYITQWEAFVQLCLYYFRLGKKSAFFKQTDWFSHSYRLVLDFTLTILMF